MYTEEKGKADATKKEEEDKAASENAKFASNAAAATRSTNAQASSDKAEKDKEAKEAEAQAARDQAKADADAARMRNREKGGCEVDGKDKPPSCERDSAYQNPDSKYQTGFDALPGRQKKGRVQKTGGARDVWGVCWEDAPTRCEQCRKDNTNSYFWDFP